MANPKFKIKHSITKKEWNKTHKDFKSIIDGIHYVMKLTDKGTALVPVKIIDEVSESLGAELDLIKQSSKDVRDFIKKVFSNSDFRDMKSDKDFLKYLKSIYEGMVKPKSGHTYYQLTKDFPVKYITGKYGMGLEVPGVLIKNKSGYIDGKKGAYLIDYFDALYYVDMKKKFASPVYSLRDQDKFSRGSITQIDMAPDYSDWKRYIKESVNEAYIVTYTKKKGEKPASAAFQLRGSALSFEKDLKKDGYITMVTQKKVKGIDESVNESADYKYLTQVILDAKPKYNVYYNSSHNVVNIGGVGYDKGELVKQFNQNSGSSSNIKNNFFHANKDPQKTKREVEKLSNGKIKVTFGKGYGNEPIVYYSLKESVNEEKVYIDFLNKKKGFKQDRIKFNSYEDAVKWAKKNFEKFNPDMIKYESINEFMMPRDVDSAMKEMGINKIPISSQGERVLKGMVKEKFLDKVTNKERLIYFVESLGKEKFGYGTKGKPLSKLVGRFWNDITSDGIFFGGEMAAYQVAMNIKDMKANGEEIDSPYEMMKEYFKNFGMDYSRSRVFNSAIRNLEEWMKRNRIEERINLFVEENEPTNPELWDRAIAAAKRKYDVYPSAYANAFASKWYGDKGGKWRTKKD